MKAMYIRQATREDVESFIPHPDDLAEAVASGINWKENLLESLGVSTVALVSEGRALAIGGCNVLGCCWFVTDILVEYLPKDCKRDFRSCIMSYRDDLLEKLPKLYNYVWSGNKSHIRFLKTIGATFYDKTTLINPHTEEQFLLFTIEGG